MNISTLKNNEYVTISFYTYHFGKMYLLQAEIKKNILILKQFMYLCYKLPDFYFWCYSVSCVIFVYIYDYTSTEINIVVTYKISNVLI